jgi:hypothetical protein
MKVLTILALSFMLSHAYAQSAIKLECTQDYYEGHEHYNCSQSDSSRKGDFSVDLRIGTDVKNALVGSKPTQDEPALDLYVAVPITVDAYDISNIKITPSYESFKRIGYQRAALEVGKEFQHNRLSYTIGAEVGVITREKHGSFVNYGINNTLEYNLTPKIAGGLLIQTQNRTDLNQIYGKVDGLPQVRLSNFVFLKINLNKKNKKKVKR